jgi:hypothetical protein
MFSRGWCQSMKVDGFKISHFADSGQRSCALGMLRQQVDPMLAHF